MKCGSQPKRRDGSTGRSFPILSSQPSDAPRCGGGDPRKPKGRGWGDSKRGRAAASLRVVWRKPPEGGRFERPFHSPCDSRTGRLSRRDGQEALSPRAAYRPSFHSSAYRCSTTATRLAGAGSSLASSCARLPARAVAQRLLRALLRALEDAELDQTRSRGANPGAGYRARRRG